MKATVSEIVVLSASPASAPSNTVSLVLSGDDQVVRVPLLIRSNTGFKISATFESKTAVLSELSVDNVRPTGTLVSPQIVSALHLNPQLDPDTSQPLLVLSGPRISLGGTLNSPNNAMEVTLLIRLTPPAGRWTAQLSLVATKQL